MTTARRRPRPASSSQPLPRIDRLAATLALGAIGLVAEGCHREPFCMNPGAIDGDHASQASWWSRVTSLFACEQHGGTTTVGDSRDANNNISPPGAIAITQPQPPPSPPPPPDPSQVEGQARAVGPQPVVVGGHSATVTPSPSHPQRTTRVRHH